MTLVDDLLVEADAAYPGRFHITSFSATDFEDIKDEKSLQDVQETLNKLQVSDYNKVDKILLINMGMDSLQVRALQIRADLAINENDQPQNDIPASRKSNSIVVTSRWVGDFQNKYSQMMEYAEPMIRDELQQALTVLAPLHDRLFDAAAKISPQHAACVMANMPKDGAQQKDTVSKLFDLMAGVYGSGAAKKLLKNQVDRTESYFGDHGLEKRSVYGPAVRLLLKRQIDSFQIHPITRAIDYVAHTNLTEPTSLASRIYARQQASRQAKLVS